MEFGSLDYGMLWSQQDVTVAARLLISPPYHPSCRKSLEPAERALMPAWHVFR